jgi:hypothetical protein
VRIPNAERAVVDIRKLREYALSAEHLRGRHKARVFESALGLTAKDAETLQAALLSAVENEDAEAGEQDEYGQRYFLDFVMTANEKSATVRSAWIIRKGEDFPRLTSCYVL